MAHVENGYFVPLVPSDISRLLRRDVRNVQRGIRALLKEGIIEKRYEKGKLIGYVIVEKT
ncbi:MAG: hypothetical protein ACHBN1_22960 [Heteroscytonema crispum UTEX LB 1556]